MQHTMKLLVNSIVLGSALSISSLGFASESKHFKGEQVETLEQAVKSFSANNKKFAAMIQDGEIDLKEMGEIHQLTYSMENALKKIKSELEMAEELLEEVHEASEHGQTETVLKDGQKYLEKAQTLVP